MLMYKMMIVEDEEIIRNGIIKSIRWNELGFVISSEATNGKEALEKMEKDIPDVVLTDIRMPVMDGLELSKIIEERFKDVRVVILSGFADFEYARQAIKYNVFEYLLKPTNKKQFIETFTKLKTSLDEWNEAKIKSSIANKKLNEGLVKLREDFINRIIEGEINSIYTFQDRINYLELNLSGKYYAVASIYIDIDHDYFTKNWNNDTGLLLYSYYNIINELLYSKSCGVAYARDINEVVIIFGYNHEKNLIRIMKDIIMCILKNIRELLFKKDCCKIYAGMGACCTDPMQIHLSYIQSKKALEKRFFESDKILFVYNNEPIEITDNKHAIRDYPSEAYSIITEILSGNIDTTVAQTKKFFIKLYSGMNPKLVKKYCYILCFLLKSSLSEFNSEYNNVAINVKDFEYDINNINSMHSLENYMLELFKESAEQIRTLNESNFSYQEKIIKQVKQYINENYAKDLSLEEISSYVFLSPTYLSFLFKSETGETYTEYLKKVRMEHAKELLKKINLKIYEVANMVGYNDYKYFTLQFKKIFGISPTEYRNKLNTIISDTNGYNNSSSAG